MWPHTILVWRDFRVGHGGIVVFRRPTRVERRLRVASACEADWSPGTGSLAKQGFAGPARVWSWTCKLWPCTFLAEITLVLPLVQFVLHHLMVRMQSAVDYSWSYISHTLMVLRGTRCGVQHEE